MIANPKFPSQVVHNNLLVEMGVKKLDEFEFFVYEKFRNGLQFIGIGEMNKGENELIILDKEGQEWAYSLNEWSVGFVMNWVDCDLPSSYYRVEY